MTPPGAHQSPDASESVVASGAKFLTLRESLCQRAAAAGLRDVLWWPDRAQTKREHFTFGAQRIATIGSDALGDEARFAFDEIERVARSMQTSHNAPQAVGVALMMQYESGPLFDEAFARAVAPQGIVVEAYAVDAVLTFDDTTQRAAVSFADDAPESRRAEFLDGMCRMMSASVVADTRADVSEIDNARLREQLARYAEFDAAEYARRANALREDIHAGRFYEVNFTHRYDVPSRVSAAVAADAVRRIGAPYGFLRMHESHGAPDILSASPELFLWRRGRDIVTMPIKGTAPRGTDAEGDVATAAALEVSEKDRAEHTMVVDLARNDLGRVCEMGSVQCRDMYRVEAMPGLHHMVTTVAGTLRADVSLYDLLAATFPAASITGAPKVEVTRAIAEQEASPRGYYCGALGMLRSDGELVLSVAIRTMIATETGYRLATGGAIVADSEADAEWQECLLKAAGLGRIVIDDATATT